MSATQDLSPGAVVFDNFVAHGWEHYCDSVIDNAVYVVFRNEDHDDELVLVHDDGKVEVL